MNVEILWIEGKAAEPTIIGELEVEKMFSEARLPQDIGYQSISSMGGFYAVFIGTLLLALVLSAVVFHAPPAAAATATTLTVDNATASFQGNTTLTATLTPAVDGATITFSVGGSSVGTSITNASGVATFNYTVTNSSGTYSIGADYAGDATYMASSGSGTLTVTQATGSMAASNVSGQYGQTVTLTATLNPASPGLTVTFLVSGASVGTATTNASGNASLSYVITDPAGTYPIQATYAGSADISAASGNGTLTVTAATGAITAANVSAAYSNSTTLTATIVPAAGGKTISFTVNGSAVGTGTTDGAGTATVSYVVGLGAGTYTIEANFAGDANITGCTGSGILTATAISSSIAVDNASIAYMDTSVLSATLLPADSGKTIAFAIDGSPVGTGTTNAAGTATLNYTATHSAGGHTIAASFAGDSYYMATGGSGTLTVNQAIGSLTVSGASTTWGTATALTATLSPAISGANIEFFIDGNSVGIDATDAGGTASVMTPPGLTVGTHSIYAAFIATPECSGCNNSNLLNVAQIATSITVTNATVTYKNSVTLTAQITPAEAGLSLDIYVSGTPVGTAVTDASGAAAISYIPMSNAGSYGITTSFAGDANHIGGSGTGTLTITQAALTVTANNATRTYGAADPAFSVTYSGFVSGEDETVLGGALSLSTSATASCTPGMYAITPSGQLSTNYMITYVDGQLDITKAPLTVTADNALRMVGTANPAFSVTYSGFVNAEDATCLGGALAFNTTATNASPTGSYSIQPFGLTSANYSFNYVNGTLLVSLPTIAAGDKHTLVVKNNSILSYGDNSAVQLTVPASCTGTTAGVTTGANCSMAILLNGTLVFWGQ
ncbi:MAG: Ig-like domain repeat protein [Solirubrobacterales bacterium]